MPLNRRDLLKASAAAPAAALKPGKISRSRQEAAGAPLRMIMVQLVHPYWYADPKHNNVDAGKNFWREEYWTGVFRRAVEDGYDAIFYWSEPWQVHQWQTWLIAHRKQPEARTLPDDQQAAVIKQVRWVFGKAHELGLKNFLINMCIVTTPPFAKAHGIDGDMPVSETVDWRHGFSASGGKDPDDKMVHWGVRNPITRDFTTKAIAELFETYPTLDGLLSTMGEALSGKRSTWYREAVAPGLKASGRRPISIIFHWMMPLDDFIEDIAAPEVYDNTWIAIEHNGEILSDVEPYAISLRWAKQTKVPIIVQYVFHNLGSLPCNSPKLAYEMAREAKRIDRYAGFAYYQMVDALQSPDYDLMGRALAYYAARGEPYRDEPWLRILEERFGDREAARHFLNAYNLSGGITPGVNQIAWCPHDGRCTHQLILKYWHWTDQDPRFSRFTSPPVGDTLLPVRHYAEVVARYGAQFRDNNGADYRWAQKLPSPPSAQSRPGLQELIWGHIDYPVTPEAHTRKIRKLGSDCAAEAALGRAKTRKSAEMAERLFHQMKSYDLLTAYYERKVQAACSALIHHFGGDTAERARAEKLADETVELYTTAANYMFEHLDKRSGAMKGGWYDESRDLPGLIEIEKKDRKDLPELFKWSKTTVPTAPGGKAKLGTTLPEK